MQIEEGKWDYLTGQRMHFNNLKRMRSKYDSDPKQKIMFSNPNIDNWVRLGDSLTGETFNGVSRKTFYEVINQKGELEWYDP